MRLKVIFTFADMGNQIGCPVSVNPDTPFDGVLSCFAYKKLIKSVSHSEAIKQATENLPLKKYGNVFYYASIPQIEGVKNKIGTVRQTGNWQLHLKDYGKDFLQSLMKSTLFKSATVSVVGKPSAGSGPAKNELFDIDFLVAKQISYVVDVVPERKAEFDELISSIDYIGKYKKFGFGRVESYEVLKTDEPIIRFVPLETGLHCKGGIHKTTAVMPPYWKKEVYLCGIAEI